LYALTHCQRHSIDYGLPLWIVWSRIEPRVLYLLLLEHVSHEIVIDDRSDLRNRRYGIGAAGEQYGASNLG